MAVAFRTPGQESILQSPGLLVHSASRVQAGRGAPGARGMNSTASLPLTVPMKFDRNAKVGSVKMIWVRRIESSCRSPEGLCFAVAPLMRPLMVSRSAVFQQ